MAKQVKRSPEVRLKRYLRRKYMRSAVASNKLTDHEDWKDGMNVFRLRITEELTEINEKLEKIMKVLNERNKE